MDYGFKKDHSHFDKVTQAGNVYFDVLSDGNAPAELVKQIEEGYAVAMKADAERKKKKKESRAADDRVKEQLKAAFAKTFKPTKARKITELFEEESETPNEQDIAIQRQLDNWKVVENWGVQDWFSEVPTMTSAPQMQEVVEVAATKRPLELTDEDDGARQRVPHLLGRPSRAETVTELNGGLPGRQTPTPTTRRPYKHRPVQGPRLMGYLKEYRAYMKDLELQDSLKAVDLPKASSKVRKTPRQFHKRVRIPGWRFDHRAAHDFA